MGRFGSARVWQRAFRAGAGVGTGTGAGTGVGTGAGGGSRRTMVGFLGTTDWNATLPSTVQVAGDEGGTEVF